MRHPGLSSKRSGSARELYDGDDDSLAAAAVNAAANGVPVWEVRQALASIDQDATEFAGRWATWNDRLAKDERGRPGNFLTQLLAISEAIAETS